MCKNGLCNFANSHLNWRARTGRAMSSNFVESRMSANITEMERRRAAAALGGGQTRIDAQHAKGKLTARERPDVLPEEGSFDELHPLVAQSCGDLGMQTHMNSRGGNRN